MGRRLLLGLRRSAEETTSFEIGPKRLYAGTLASTFRRSPTGATEVQQHQRQSVPILQLPGRDRLSIGCDGILLLYPEFESLDT